MSNVHLFETPLLAGVFFIPAFLGMLFFFPSYCVQCPLHIVYFSCCYFSMWPSCAEAAGSRTILLCQSVSAVCFQDGMSIYDKYKS